MNKINRIFIGSNNKGKFREISDLLPKTIEKISPDKLNIDSPEEYGKSFLENSEIKADYFCKKSNMITISDDSGLEVSCLNGMPGIFSARWADQYGSFDNAMSEVLNKISYFYVNLNINIYCSYENLGLKVIPRRIITNVLLKIKRYKS